MKRVAVYTTFYEAASGFSLTRVAETQIRMLLDHGYDPVVLVRQDFAQPDDPLPIWNKESVDLRDVLPTIGHSAEIGDDFEEQVQAVLESLREGLAGVDVVITHDLILQEYYIVHNAAMRLYAKERPEVAWLHWLHSVPVQGGKDTYPQNLRYSPPPGRIVYPNNIDRPIPIRTYRLQEQEHRVIPCRAGHAIDPLLIADCDPLTADLAERSDLLSGDISVVYPARMNREKQPDKIVRILAGVQKAGYDPRLLVIDWQSQGQHFQKFMDEVEDLADSYSLAGKVHFSSRLDDRATQGVPHHIVMELLGLTNVYIHPSKVETYSIVVHEAMTQGLLVVLNHDLPLFRELFGPNAIYMDFGSTSIRRDYTPNEQAFWNDEALRLIAEYRQNRALVAKTVARRQWTPQALWRDFEYLLYLEPLNEDGV